MNQHLSSEQIDKWVAGDRTAAAEQHARECTECRAKLAEFEGALALFRGAVHDWSEQQGARSAAWGDEPVRPRWHFQPMRWALAGVALLILATIPFAYNAREKQRQAELAKADALLLEQVDAEISRPVPATMEPLVRLVAWDPSASSSGDRQTRQKGERPQ